MKEAYQKKLENNLSVLQELPVVIPDEGRLVGFDLYAPEGLYEFIENDNLHYPMGTSFLKLGVLGIAEKAERVAKTKTEEQEKDFLLCIAGVYRAVAAYFARYLPVIAEKKETLKSTGGDAYALQKEEERLTFLYHNMEVLAKGGVPETFAQALQLYYLMYRVRCLSTTACLGRLDVHFRPFYEADIKARRTTEEEVLSLLCEFYERLNRCGSGDTLVNLMVGGKNEKGEDDSSDLSILMLRALRVTRKTEPHINIRYHKNIRQDLLEEALQVQLMGHGQATLYNDEVVIPSLVEHGYPLEYACCYANDGCTEIVFDGYSSITFTHIDALAAFELALNNGELTPKKSHVVPYFHRNNVPDFYTPEVLYGFESGETDSLTTYEEFYECFLRQYRHQVFSNLSALKNHHNYLCTLDLSFFFNGTFDSILERGKGVLSGGLPVDCYMTFMGSIPTVADCLCALKKVVYEEKKYTLVQVKEALAANFDGYEEMRNVLLHAPKFGNNIEEVDQIAADIAAFTCDMADDFQKETGFYVMPALVGWRFLQEAYGVGATPDGRKYGDPIAEHYCATPGRAQNGPTALLHSITRAPLYRATGCAATHISLPASVSKDEQQGLAILRSLMKTAIDEGIMMLNVGIYDAEALKKAQQNPEEYSDLIVRVWGFSARFIDLSREMQDHILSRILQ